MKTIKRTLLIICFALLWSGVSVAGDLRQSLDEVKSTAAIMKAMRENAENVTIEVGGKTYKSLAGSLKEVDDHVLAKKAAADAIVVQAQTDTTDALHTLRAFTPRGAWGTGTAYSAKDLYTDSGVTYIVLDAHTSTTVTADLSSGHVAVYQGDERLVPEVASLIKGVRYPSTSAAIADHGAASGADYTAGNLRRTIDQAGGLPASISIPADITITTSMEIPANKLLDLRSGATITVDGCVLTINGGITSAIRDDVFVLQNGGTVGGDYHFIDRPTVPTIASLRGLRGSAGQTIQLRGYYTPGDGGGGPERYFASGAPGTYVDNGGSIIVPSGGDGSEAWLWHLSGAVDIRYFGGVSLGDCTTAAQAIIDDGSDLFLPVGTWKLNNVTIQASQNVIGAGGQTLVLPTDDAIATDYIFKIVGVAGSEIRQLMLRDFVIRGGSGPLYYDNRPQTNGIFATAIYWLSLSNVVIRDLRGCGLLLSDEVKESSVNDCIVAGCGDTANSRGAIEILSTASAIDAPNNINLNNVRIIWPYYYGLYLGLDTGATKLVRQVTVSKCMFHGLYDANDAGIITAPYPQIYSNGSTRTKIRDSQFTIGGYNVHNIRFDGGAAQGELSIMGCTFPGSNDYEANTIGGGCIYIDRTEKVTILGNNFNGYRNYAVTFGPAMTSSPITMSDNTYIKNLKTLSTDADNWQDNVDMLSFESSDLIGLDWKLSPRRRNITAEEIAAGEIALDLDSHMYTYDITGAGGNVNIRLPDGGDVPTGYSVVVRKLDAAPVSIVPGPVDKIVGWDTGESIQNACEGSGRVVKVTRISNTLWEAVGDETWNQVHGSVSWTPGTIAAGAEASITLTLNPVHNRDYPIAVAPSNLLGLTLDSFISSQTTGEITIVLRNHTAGDITAPSGVYWVHLHRR